MTVRLRRDGEHVVIGVIDHGMGIDAAHLPYIFTPFFRADRSRTRKTVAWAGAWLWSSGSCARRGQTGVESEWSGHAGRCARAERPRHA